MKRYLSTAFLFSLLLLAAAPSLAAPVGSAFTYQGKLNFSNTPVDEPQDFQFGLYNDAGDQIGTTVTLAAVAVNNGLFSVPLDFGPNAFGNDQRLLQIMVKSPAEQNYTALTPRLKITPVPIALSVTENGVTNNSISPGAISRDKLSSDYAAYISASQSHPWIVAPYSDVLFDSLRAQKGIIMFGLGSFLIPTTGVYQISVSLDFSTGSNYDFGVNVNYIQVAKIAASAAPPPGNTAKVSRTILLPLNAGDVLSISSTGSVLLLTENGQNTLTIVQVD